MNGGGLAPLTRSKGKAEALRYRTLLGGMRVSMRLWSFMIRAFMNDISSFCASRVVSICVSLFC